MPIIESLLDLDFYKLTMQQVVFRRFPDTDVEYAFKIRNANDGILVPFKDEIEEEIYSLGKLKFTDDGLDYLRTIPFFKNGYLAFLRNFRLNPEDVYIYIEDGGLKIRIRGSWLNTILFETPVLSIVSEIWDRDIGHPVSNRYAEGMDRLEKKVKDIQEYDYATEFRFADFGARRRFTREWHEIIVREFLKRVPIQFVGTSDVYLAWKYGTKPIGTMAHEYISAFQGMPEKCGVRYSQRMALEEWAQEYRGNLGIALSDTLGMDAFLDDFDLYFAKLFDGARQDSGDPFEWGERLIEHYRKLGIFPFSKTAIFSDGLNLEKAFSLYDRFRGRLKMSFGIGTNLTNDVGIEPLNIVIKMIKCNGNPVAKISDSPGKQMCTDIEYLRYLASIFNISQDRVEIEDI